jgi:GNAT superfamily N-acetyltransferase
MAALPPVTPELAARLQQAEVEFTESRFRGLQRLEGNPLGVEIRRWGRVGAFKMSAAHAPIPNLLRGLTGEDADRVDEILDWFADAPFIVGLTPALVNEALLHRLAECGLYQSSFITMTYSLPNTDVPPLPLNVTVQEFHGDALNQFAAYVVAIDEAPEGERDFWQKVRAAEFAEWRGYVAFIEGQPAARAAMAIRKSLATLGAAVTHPKLRGRGCQTALLRQRLADAAAARCELVIAGANPGTVSERNLQRAGFHIAYTAAHWTPKNL